MCNSNNTTKRGCVDFADHGRAYIAKALEGTSQGDLTQLSMVSHPLAD